MIEYNKTIKTTTEICLSDNGVFCEEWQIDSEITYPLATIVIFLQIVVFLLAIKLFSRR